MSPNKESALLQKYPSLFKQYSNSTKIPLSWYGIECYDGWYHLIDDLCSKIEPLVKDNTWQQSLEEVPSIVQIKEKFGGLRFYMTSETDEMMDLIEKTEEESYKICELCGEKGQLDLGPWYKTRCRSHWENKVTYSQTEELWLEKEREDYLKDSGDTD